MLCNYPDRKQMAGEVSVSDALKESFKKAYSVGANKLGKNEDAEDSKDKKTKHTYVEDSIEAGEELLRRELSTIAVRHGMYRPYEARVYRFRNNCSAM